MDQFPDEVLAIILEWNVKNLDKRTTWLVCTRWQQVIERSDKYNIRISANPIALFKNIDDKLWWSVTRYHVLSEDFIGRYSHKVDWREISQCQKLSEEFIADWCDKVHWIDISYAQKISEGFRARFKLRFGSKK